MPKCKYCKTKFEAFTSLDKFCSIKHAIAWTATPEGIQAIKKVKLKRNEAKNKQARSDKRELDKQTLSWQHKQTQKAFNKLRRLQEIKWFEDQNKEPECISCGKQKMDWCCGHFITAGSSGNLRYSPKNTFLQCNFYCNQNLSGNRKGNKNTRGYEQGLIDRFGSEKGQEIIDWCEENQHKTKKYTCDELAMMRGRFNSAIRQL